MLVTLQDVGKRFRQKWVLTNLNLVFKPGKQYVIAGNNGSGKSTLLKMISGYFTPTSGVITWHKNGKTADPDHVFSSLSFTGPYLELPEELTSLEIIRFHRQFKNFPANLTNEDILHIAGLHDAGEKSIRDFSSGMKQRVKLALAILPETSLLLLDEPCTNLDAKACLWYKKLIEKFGRGKTLVVASNHNPDEYGPEFSMITL